MNRLLVFDIETDGLYEESTKVHVLGYGQVDQTAIKSCRGNFELPLAEMETAHLVGHNIVGFDIPVLKKLYPWWRPKGKVIDTLLLSRLIFPDIMTQDASSYWNADVPKEHWGSHSLAAWGHRLGEHKGDFKGPWDAWSQEMEDYCRQDVEVTRRLATFLLNQNADPRAVDIEHRFAEIIEQMSRHGFLFDSAAASTLASEVGDLRNTWEKKAVETFPPTKVEMKKNLWLYDGRPYATKAAAIDAAVNDGNKKSYAEKNLVSAGGPIVREEPFNPNSRKQIAERLQALGWVPTEFTETGQPKVDEDTLKECGIAEAEPLAHVLSLTKLLGQISDGDQAWLKHVRKDDRIHGRVITNGAVTGRCTHSNPNMAQVPKVGSPYGEECRGLFTVPAGKKLVGCDAAALELRCLAHYMARYDGGAYADLVVHGDVHTANQNAAKLPTRDNAKTFIYGFLYGAGDAKIGKIVGGDSKRGKELKEQFLASTPALKRLREEVATAAKKRGYLIGLDGRRLPIRKPHAALNTLLQSAGAVIMKQATIILYDSLAQEGLTFGEEWALVAHIHDEMQIEVDEDIAEEVGKMAADSIRLAGEHFKTACPMGGEYRVGSNWSETH